MALEVVALCRWRQSYNLFFICLWHIRKVNVANLTEACGDGHGMWTVPAESTYLYLLSSMPFKTPKRTSS